MRISDWSSDVCSTDHLPAMRRRHRPFRRFLVQHGVGGVDMDEDLAPDVEALERREGAGAAVDAPMAHPLDRKSVVAGKSVSVRVVLGGVLIINTHITIPYFVCLLVTYSVISNP